MRTVTQVIVYASPRVTGQWQAPTVRTSLLAPRGSKVHSKIRPYACLPFLTSHNVNTGPSRLSDHGARSQPAQRGSLFRLRSVPHAGHTHQKAHSESVFGPPLFGHGVLDRHHFTPRVDCSHCRRGSQAPLHSVPVSDRTRGSQVLCLVRSPQVCRWWPVQHL